MFTHERHRALIALLERKRRLSNADLIRALRVSPATLRRDLANLEADGLVVRFHGGAANPLYLRAESSLEQRSRESISAKRAMAETAAKLVPPQQTVFLDAGSSCLEVGRVLMARKDLTLIANSIAFAEIARSAAARVLCIGGELRGLTSALVGGLALSWLENLRADWAFVGATGLSEEGASTTELSESAVKQALLRRAGKGVLVAEASKWDKPAAVRFAPWTAFAYWIASDRVPVSVHRTVMKFGGPRILGASAATPSKQKQRKRKS